MIGKKIVQDAEKGEELKRTAQDAYVHSQFLRKEISYNDILLASMERIRSIKADIDGAELSTAQHETMRAVKLLSGTYCQSVEETALTPVHRSFPVYTLAPKLPSYQSIYSSGRASPERERSTSEGLR